MLLAGGWWVAIVELWPASSRPYIGGSQHNSILELTLGYNGFGRLTGNETGSVGGGPAGRAAGGGRPASCGCSAPSIGGQVAWLLPAALILLVAGLWFTRRAPRTDLVRAGLVVWGGWLLVTGLTFSFMAGIFHAYYTVALAPAIAALVGIGAVMLWRRRTSYAAALVMSGTVVDHDGRRVLPARPDARLPAVAEVGRRACSGSSSALAAGGRAAPAAPASRSWSPPPLWLPGWPGPRRTPSRRRAPRTPARSSAPARAKGRWVVPGSDRRR